ncbi:MAG: hypothetical protein ACYC1C_16525, partial [Chloroflexota bacterium]
AALEYLIARATPAAATQPVRGRTGRGAVVAGAAAPLLVVPLAVLAMAFNGDVRGQISNLGYQYSAARVMLVMDNVDRWGQHMVVSSSCSLAPFQAGFPHEVRDGGKLVDYPAPGQRSTSPDLVLTALRLDDGEPPGRITAALERTAMLSSQLWYMRCGGASAADQVVEGWLDKQTHLEQMWLPGLPPISLTRVTPTVPPACESAEYAVDSPQTFGEGEVTLNGYRWTAGNMGGQTALRVTLIWQTHAKIDKDLHVFVHLVDSSGKLISQSDGVPIYDRYPFGKWAVGEVVADNYDVALPAGTLPENVEIRVGLYDFQSGQRLKVGAGDYVRLE